MATAARTVPELETPAFAVEELRVDADRAHVTGRWSGIRGRRFLRPTLVLDGAHALAALDHKPWAAVEDARWIAAFPWDGTAEDLARATLEVAPGVVVPLGPEASVPERTASRRASSATREAAPSASRRAESSAARDRATARADVAAATAGAPEPEPPEPDPRVAELRSRLRAAERAQAEAEREARATATDRDRAREQLAEAIRDREAALRTRERMGEQLAAAETAAAAAASAREDEVTRARRDRDERVADVTHDRTARLAEARDCERRLIAERDAAVAERDRFRAQRDEVITAHRSLEHVLDRERALRDSDRDDAAAERGPVGAPAARPRRPSTQTATPPPEPGATVEMTALDTGEPREVPIGIRAVPAARDVPADLLRRDTGRPPLQAIDVWALRILASAAAACFVLLLFLLLRLFL